MISETNQEEEGEFRCYGELETPLLAVPNVSTSKLSNDEKVSLLGDDIIGCMAKFTTPFGEKPIVYADWTASGRCVGKIESYVTNTVMPFYGNTHTTTSITGHQSTCFRHEARQIIAEACNAKITGKAAEDVVLFCGNGTTACVNKLVSILGLNTPFTEDLPEKYRPVVFTSSYEHHSNLLPWRESAALVITIPFDPIHGVSLTILEQELQKYQDHVVKIGAFSAASNVTGLLTDVDRISILLHQYQALACFDYATAAPYVKMDMNPVILSEDNPRAAYKDAIYFSSHKFLGGPSASGVLVIKRSLLPSKRELPGSDIGGGTVFFVTEEHHRYLSNREEREEGGTPMIIADIRAGLAMHLKRSLGQHWIEERELEIARYVTSRLQQCPQVILLGDKRVERKLPIFSVLLQCHEKFLHFHFVAVLLNDLFGIQARGGCMCAGPYAQFLLDLSPEVIEQFEGAMLDKHEVLRPGFTRLSFPYWMNKEEIDYILDALEFVAVHGWKFIPQYRYNYKTGEWAHTTRLTRFPERLWLSKLDFFASTSSPATGCSSRTRQEVMQQDWPSFSNIKSLFAHIQAQAQGDLEKLEGSKEFKKQVMAAPTATTATTASSGDGAYSLQGYEHLRWFLVADDLKRRGFDALNIEKLVSPILPRLRAAGPDATPTTATDMSHYAKQRNELIRARTGTEMRVPRYLGLACRSEAEQLGILEVMRRNALRYLQSAAAGIGMIDTSGVVAATGGVKGEKVKGEREKARPAATAATDGEELTCSTGTCSLRSRPAVAVTQPVVIEPSAPVVLSSGKILSGPGHTFRPEDLPSSSTNPATTPAFKFHQPPKKIMKLVGQAVKEWNMIEEGDRLLLGLSGGKDSLALLHVLHALQKRAPVKFTFACATVDPQTDSFDPSPLIPYVQGLGITYHYLSEPIVELANSKLQGDSLCAFCSRFKRGLLYSCCRTHNYNKLVLAQHLDDLVESFLMSCLHNGQLRTMKANYTIEAGDVRVIRPFIYLRESSTRDFSQSVQLPIINENCPACFEEPKERARMKKLMEQEEAMVPALFHNLRKALLPMLHDDFYETTRRIQQEVESTGSKPGARVSSKRLKAGATETVALKVEGEREGGRAEEEGGERGDAMETVGEEGEEGGAKRAKRGGETAEEIFHAVLSNSNASCQDGYCAPCFELA